MKIGIYFDGRNPAQWFRPWPEHYARIIELAVEAERLGAGSVWLSEHHLFADGYLPQPLTLAAAIAARTQRVRLATAVLIPTLRKPMQLAEEAAVVDIISDGRVELGLGVGYRVPEYEAFGADIATRYVDFERVMREVDRLWGVVTPRPVQRPIPCWGGFFGPRGASLAGRLGMGLLSLDAALVQPYVAGLEAGGLGPERARMGGVVNVVVSEDPERAWPRISPHLRYQLDSYNAHSVQGTGRPVPKPVDPEHVRRPTNPGRSPGIFVLTPDEAVARVTATCADLPVEHVFFWASVGAMPDDLVDEHVSLVSGVVAARLATRPGP